MSWKQNTMRGMRSNSVVNQPTGGGSKKSGLATSNLGSAGVGLLHGRTYMGGPRGVQANYRNRDLVFHYKSYIGGIGHSVGGRSLGRMMDGVHSISTSPAPSPEPLPRMCKVSDPDLDLSFGDAGVRAYSVTTNAMLENVCNKCSSIDYLWINNCKDCKQETINKCGLEAITWGDPTGGWNSLTLEGSPLITTPSFPKLSGKLVSQLDIKNMPNLTSLDGLENLESICENCPGTCDYPAISIFNNPKLVDVRSIDKAFTSKESKQLWMPNNPSLSCVPKDWPKQDCSGSIIRNGKDCSEPVTYMCIDYQCVPTVGSGGSKEDCEAICNQPLPGPEISPPCKELTRISSCGNISLMNPSDCYKYYSTDENVKCKTNPQIQGKCTDWLSCEKF